MVQMASSSTPVTIRVSSGGKGGGGGGGGGGFRSIALTSPIRRSSISNNPNSPLSSSSSSSRGNRTASSGGRYYCSMSKDEVTEAVNSDFTVSYTVHIPRTPDRKPMSSSSSSQTSLPEEETTMTHEKPETSYISGTIFTGGFNSVTHGHVIERSSDRSETVKSMGIVCSINGCDGKALLEGDSRMPC